MNICYISRLGFLPKVCFEQSCMYLLVYSFLLVIYQGLELQVMDYELTSLIWKSKFKNPPKSETFKYYICFLLLYPRLSNFTKMRFIWLVDLEAQGHDTSVSMAVVKKQNKKLMADSIVIVGAYVRGRDPITRQEAKQAAECPGLFFVIALLQELTEVSHKSLPWAHLQCSKDLLLRPTSSRSPVS